MGELFLDFFKYFIIYFPFIAFGGISIYMIAYGIFCIAKIYSCTDLVDGYCTDKQRTIKYRRSETYCMFTYRYEGKDYYSKSKYGLSTSLFNYIKKGDKYTIYVNAKKPELFVVERKITFNEIFLIGSGLFLLGYVIFQAFKTGMF